MNIKHIITTLIILISGSSLFAQYRSEISFDLFGGLSSLHYKTEMGDHKNGLGGGAGFGYRFLIDKKSGIGIQTGVNVALMNAQTELDGIVNSLEAYDGTEYFEFIYALSDMEEKQQAIMLNIPLMAYWETGYTDRFYMAAGVKVGVPLKSTYKVSDDATLKTAGYYSNIDALLEDPAPMGFGTYNMDVKNDLKLKPAFMISVELGMKWKLKRNYFLATSLYFDYGLNNIKKSNSYHDFISYNAENPADYQLHGIFASQFENASGETVKVAEKIVPFAVGAKVSLLLGTGERYRRNDIKDWLWP